MRFKEFEGEWEKKKLWEVVTNKSRKYNPENAANFVMCIELEHIVGETGQLLGYTDGSKSGSIKNVFNKGDVLFGKLRPYLKKYHHATFDGVSSSEIWVLKAIGISSDFLYQLVQTNSFIELANQSSGSKMPRADWTVVENGLFHFPSFSEQQKIATFLTIVDERISAERKIIGELEKLMKGIGEELFSKRLRFKDKNGNAFPEWEVKKLGDIGETYNGLIGKKKEDFGIGKYYIQYKQIFDQSKIDILKCGLVDIGDNENQNIVKKGDIFFTISSETPEEIGMSSVLLDDIEVLYLNSFCFGYRPSSVEILNSSFSRFLFRSEIFRNEIIKLAQGSTRYNMSKIELMKLKIHLPIMKEQIYIASFLSSIDEKIKTEKNLLLHYESQKTYLLQKLFI